MSENIETEYHDICYESKQVLKRYCHYGFNYKCNDGDTYFEIVRYCRDCEPVPITKIHLNRTINITNYQ